MVIFPLIFFLSLLPFSSYQTLTTILYYQRFIGNFYHDYSLEAGNSESCDPGSDCLSSLQGFNGFSTTSLSYPMDSTLVLSCSGSKIFGATLFGLSDTITKTFKNLPSHTGVTVTFDLWKLDDWQMNLFTVTLDDLTLYTMAFDGDWGTNLCGSSSFHDLMTPVTASSPTHTSSSLTIALLNDLEIDTSLASFAIQNLRVFLSMSCPIGCLTCNAQGLCLTCLNFAAMTAEGACTCQAGFYLESTNYSRCEKCHYSCKTCLGAGADQCDSCFGDDSLASGSCSAQPYEIKSPLEFPYSGFEVSALSSWTASPQPIISTGCGFILVGGFNEFASGASLQKTFGGLSLPHYKITVRVDFFRFDDWDPASSLFLITVDGTSRGLAVPDTAYMHNYCGGASKDGFITFQEDFSHTAAQATVKLATNLAVAPGTASWGVINFQFSYSSCHPTCKTCSGPSDSECLTCYLNATLSATHSCPCDPWFAVNAYSIPCSSNPCSYCCATHCANCTQGNCSQCQAGYYLKNNRCYMTCRVGCVYCETSPLVCLTCDVGFYKIGQTCEPYCPSGYYPRSSDSTCQLCDPSCRLCSGASSRDCTACAKSYFLISGACVACDPACLSCTGNPSNCTACTGSLNLFAGSCSMICQVGYYANNNGICMACSKDCVTCTDANFCQTCKSGQMLAQSGRCIPCDLECSTCSGATDYCLSCVTGQYLRNNNCWQRCPAGEFGNENTGNCEVCSSDCLTCQVSSTQCTGCRDGKLLVGTACLPCSGCQTCANTVSNCLSCSSGLYLYNGSCVTDCLPLYYKASNGSCLKCHSSCASCNYQSSFNCTSCFSGYYLKSSTGECLVCYQSCLTCVASPTYCLTCQSPLALYDHQCLSTCPNGTYKDSPSRTCKPCDASCKTCSAGGTTSCLTCPGGYYFANNQCYPCPHGCLLCSSPSNCTACQWDHSLLNYQCLDNCNFGYWRDLKVNQCKPCSSSCADCTGPTSHDCTACQTHEALSGGSCYSCDPSCLTCRGIGYFDCTSCHPGKLLEDNVCVSSCSAYYYQSGASCFRCSFSCLKCSGPGDHSCKSCNDTLFFYITDTAKRLGYCYTTCPAPLKNDVNNLLCLTGCPPGTFYDTVRKRCDNCYASCSECAAADALSCTSCLNGLFRYSATSDKSIGECMSDCPDRFYANRTTKTCEPCIKYCEKCEDDSNCSLCDGNYYVCEGNRTCSMCRSTQSEGVWRDGDFCRNCSVGCQQCNSSDYCLKCFITHWLNGSSCIEKTRIVPSLTPHETIPLIYNLTLSPPWALLFNNLTQNTSTYSVAIRNCSIKKFKTVIKYSKFQADYLELIVNLTTTLPETTLTLTFYPPDDNIFYLSPVSLEMPVPPFVYCGFLKSYYDGACHNLSIITPSLSLIGPQKLRLSFSEDFSEIVPIFNVSSHIYLENISPSIYNITAFYRDPTHYEVRLEFNQSMLKTPNLLASFDLPAYLIMHPTKRLYPSIAIIVVSQYIIISNLAYEAMDIQQAIDNITSSLLVPMAAAGCAFSFSFTAYFGLISIKKIDFLKYIDINYPQNALSVFGPQSATSELPIDYRLLYEILWTEKNSSLPTRFSAYGVKLGLLNAILKELLVLGLLLALGIVAKILFARTNRKSLIWVRKILFLNAFLFLFSALVMDITFHALANIHFHDSHSTDASINLIFSIGCLLAIIATFQFIYHALKFYCPAEEEQDEKANNPAGTNVIVPYDCVGEQEDRAFSEKRPEEVKKPESQAFTKSPTLSSDITAADSRPRQTTKSNLKEGGQMTSEYYAHIARPTLFKKAWWDNKGNKAFDNKVSDPTLSKNAWWDNKDNKVSDSPSLMSPYSLTAASILIKPNRKSVAFRERVQQIVYDPHYTVAPKPSRDWSFILVLTRDYHYKTISERLFVLFALLRDCTFPLFLVVFADNPYLSICSLTIVNVIFFAFFLAVRPFKNSSDFMLFMFFEVCVGVSIISGLVIVMADEDGDSYTNAERMDKGWVIFYGHMIAQFLLMGIVGWAILSGVCKVFKCCFEGISKPVRKNQITPII